jgi:hypothetical protein
MPVDDDKIDHSVMQRSDVDEAVAKLRALRKEHDGHIVHDPTCAFCCGDIT